MLCSYWYLVAWKVCWFLLIFWLIVWYCLVFFGCGIIVGCCWWFVCNGYWDVCGFVLIGCGCSVLGVLCVFCWWYSVWVCIVLGRFWVIFIDVYLGVVWNVRLFWFLVSFVLIILVIWLVCWELFMVWYMRGRCGWYCWCWFWLLFWCGVLLWLFYGCVCGENK